jgi:two-component system, chemotaxis family, protein-glutamate methylesterase/glutaminase
MKVVVLVAPANGVTILRSVLDRLPPDFPAAIVILLHTVPGRETPVAHKLNVNPHPLVLPGSDGATLRAERAHIVFPAQNLAIGENGCLAIATEGDASEPILASLAVRYGPAGIAVALTALDAREAEGFRLVREAGGHTIALDERDQLWTESADPRVVPVAGDELVTAPLIGGRMFEILSALPA